MKLKNAHRSFCHNGQSITFYNHWNFCFFFLMFFFFPNWVNQLLYHQDSELMDKNLKIIMIGFIPGSLSFLLGAFIQAIHREKKLVLIYLSMTILNGILNYF